MKRHFVLAAALAAAACSGSLALGAANDLIPEPTANRHGLTRPWFAQADLDISRDRVRSVVLDRGALFVQTDRARIHAFDAETGRSLWSKQVGRANHPSMTPGLSDKLLVSLNGSRLYALNRRTGELLYETDTKGAPGAGPAVSSSRAYVPMVSGMVMAFRLEPTTDPRKELGIAKHEEGDELPAAEAVYEDLRLKQETLSPVSCQSQGRVLVQPIVISDKPTEEYTCWPSDMGYLNIGYIEKHAGSESFAITTRKADVFVEARPALRPGSADGGTPGVLFFGGRDGFVYAISTKNGDELWRFSAGTPVLDSPALLDDRLYVSTQLGGLFCLEAKPSNPAGKQIWFSPKVARFLAASESRVYGLDRLGKFVILDAASGVQLDTLPVGDVSHVVTNTETDRVYLITKTGMVQCLHEIELATPIKHNAAAAEKKAEEPADGEANTPDEKKPGKGGGAEDANPFGDAKGADDAKGAKDAPADDGGNPFGDVN